MNYVNAAHEGNYFFLSRMFSGDIASPRYRTACYILAVPEIFGVMRCYIDPNQKPFDWALQFEDIQSSYQDPKSKDPVVITNRIYKTDDYGQRAYSDGFYSLNEGYQALVRLAMHLFEQAHSFNLCAALLIWNDEQLGIYHEAVQLRLDHLGGGKRR